MKPFPAALFAFLILPPNLAIAADQPYEEKGARSRQHLKRGYRGEFQRL
jgi:hypothetical protein